MRNLVLTKNHIMRKNLFKSKVLLCLLVNLFCIGFAQAQTGTLSGFVKDEKGVPLASATVALVGKSKSALTDEAGNYSFKFTCGCLQFSC